MSDQFTPHQQSAASALLESLAKLRVPFEQHQISKLPKPTKQQTDEVSKDFSKGIRCDLCGSWHHPKVVHLDYVGHAALTDRLLDVDPLWSWESLALDAKGLPALDSDGGMWIKLTVCGISRLGYGDAQGKQGPNATKERIGDALRNAGMRFGMALELWHKGILHMDSDDPAPQVVEKVATPRAQKPKPAPDVPVLIMAMEATKTQDALRVAFASAWKASGQSQEVRDAYERLKAGYGAPAEPVTPEGGA